MNIKSFEAFMAVIEYKTMSLAAEKLYTSQPNISHMIKDIEKKFNTKLFNRHNKHLSLTPEGLIFEKHAKNILMEYQRLQISMASSVPVLRIGSSVTVGQYLLHNYIKKIREYIPEIKCEIVINNTQIIENLLMDNQLDISFVEGVIKSPSIHEIELLSDELIAVIASDYPLDKPITHIEDLQELPWIRRERGSQDRNQFETALNERHIRPEVVFRSTNLESILQAVTDQYGFAIISRIAADPLIKKGTIKEIKLLDYTCTRTIRFAFHQDNNQSPLIKNILKSIHQ